jgi:hypothetical protein
MARFLTRTPVLAAIVFGAVTPLALSGLASAEQPAAETFAGECELSGTARHQPPLTQEPAPTKVRGRFSGTCSGELTGQDGRTRQLEDARATYRARGLGELSCLGGVATGAGSLTFAGGHEIEFTLTERRPAPGVAVVTLEGATGGWATVLGTVSSSEDPAEINERCNGSGLRSVRGDARIVSPGISG